MVDHPDGLPGLPEQLRLRRGRRVSVGGAGAGACSSRRRSGAAAGCAIGSGVHIVAAARRGVRSTAARTAAGASLVTRSALILSAAR